MQSAETLGDRIAGLESSPAHLRLRQDLQQRRQLRLQVRHAQLPYHLQHSLPGNRGGGQPRVPLHSIFRGELARVPAFPVALHGTTHEPQQHRLHRQRSQCETGPFQDVGEELALPGRAARMISRWRPASVCLCRSWPRGIEPAHRTASQVSPWPQQRGSSSRDRPAAKDSLRKSRCVHAGRVWAGGPP